LLSNWPSKRPVRGPASTAGIERMPLLTLIRRLAWGGVALAGFVVLATGAGWFVTDGPAGGDRSPGIVSAGAVGPPFSMIDQHGRPFTQAELDGRPSMLFFGFTSCPDVCPTTLSDIGVWLDALGPDGDRIRPVFVTVDPERDTAADLAAYLASFDARIVGLTGSSEQLAAFAAAYRVYYRKVPTDAGYTMDHSASVFLFDRSRRFVGAVDFHEDPATAIAKIRRLL
jgi:protein SCO1/2